MDYQAIQKNFEDHGFQVQFCATKEDAAAFLAGQFSGRTIGFGGSVTLDEMGLYETLSRENVVVWHQKCNSMAVRQLETKTEIFLSSVNGASETGELVNIDGAGNRLAMTIWGPKEVYYVVGRNKFAPTLEGAIHRAKNIAAPKNARRLKRNTPCAAQADRCYDCKSPERLCRCTAIFDRAMIGMPTTIVLVDEDLGY